MIACASLPLMKSLVPGQTRFAALQVSASGGGHLDVTLSIRPEPEIHCGTMARVETDSIEFYRVMDERPCGARRHPYGVGTPGLAEGRIQSRDIPK